MQKKRILGILLLILLLTGLWGGAQYLNGDRSGKIQEEFVITALPVGKADALIVQQGEFTMLVDTGEKEDGAAIIEAVQKRGIEALDILLVTHFDKDHVGSAAQIVEELSPELVLMPDYEGDRPEYQEFLQALPGQGDARRVSDIFCFSEGALGMTVYPAQEPEALMDTKKEYDNDLSLVASITYGSRSFLLTGDVEKGRIQQMLAQEEDWSHDWIKLPHHGRYKKNLDELLRAVNPSSAVACASEEEPVEEKTRKLLEELQIPLWDTARQAVVTVSDGERIEVRYE